MLLFVFEETARENRERREREILCVWSRNALKQERIARVQSVTKRTHAH